MKTLDCSGSNVGKGKLSDLSPLAGMKLMNLDCEYTTVSNLSPLEGMPLTYLGPASVPRVSDLSPLKGIKSLAWFSCGNTPVENLSPLHGLQLTHLGINFCKITDLSPLAGMPLTDLVCDHSPVAEVSALANCLSLKNLDLRSTHVTPGGVAAPAKSPAQLQD